jgi:hypothetical protein
MNRIHLILYVNDQAHSADFYARVLACAPSLNVPGMTEFTLSANCVLGLMPEAGSFFSATPVPSLRQAQHRLESPDLLV